MSQPEVWLRGPVADLCGELQPVAHCLLQASEEINTIMYNFPDELLWLKKFGVASVGFHLQHIPGVLDRLITYAEGSQLSEEQLAYLHSEGQENKLVSAVSLTEQTVASIHGAVQRLHNFEVKKLAEQREVGRKKLPSTVRGLLFHAAEHTMRHTGQLHVTTAMLKAMHQAGDHQ